ncbi:recombinase family protein [Rufibacter sp. XAAS-G3-1]|uniref:recombinase family protein n=1 Tax=Rufibacter sp. XAAS-G3-1 TaxID=2729134 RepID=UPI0015E6E696|nr:recombinase family protein [Rufibacter sp. XAAS-G3-1]
MKKAALLLRVSSNGQSTDRQLSELTSYANGKGLDIIEVVTEKISGAKKNSERQGIQRILELARAKQIDKVLVHEISRLGRNTPQVLATIEELHELKVSVVVLNYQIETLNANGSVNSMGMFMVTMLTDIGRMERETTVERINSGIAEAKRKGVVLGRPEGSKKGKTEMLKEYKQVVKKLQEGYSIRETAKLCDVSVSTVQRVKKEM